MILRIEGDKGVLLFLSSVCSSDVQVRERRLIVQPTAARVAFDDRQNVKSDWPTLLLNDSSLHNVR